jgi:hypothetical protein
MMFLDLLVGDNGHWRWLDDGKELLEANTYLQIESERGSRYIHLLLPGIK